MKQDWKPSIFTDLNEAKNWIYNNAATWNVVIEKNILSLIEKNEIVFNAFLGKSEAVAVSFYFTDLEGDDFDGSEIFLIVSKFEINFTQGLWNYDKDFSLSMATKILFDKFTDIK